MDFINLLIVLLFAALFGGAIVAWLILRRREKTRFISRMILLLFFVGASSLVSRFIYRAQLSRSSEWFTWPLTFALSVMSGVIVTVVAILIAFRRFRTEIFGNARLPDFATPKELHEAVINILDSDSFLTALRSTLPQGKEDQQFGLDYIPFMLNAVDERRRRAAKSARLFLLSTVTAAVIFSSVVMYFGYVLVNEAGAGTGKALVDLKDATRSISENLQLINASYFQNTQFQRDVAPSLERLATLDPGEKNKGAQAEITDTLSSARANGDLDQMRRVLVKAISEVSKDTPQGKDYAQAINSASDKLNAFIGRQSGALSGLPAKTSQLDVLIPKVEESLAKPENRTPELIKRIGLGVVISTFFLALLRYLGNLYRIRYLQVVQAERDDFMIRRFYVALKNSSVSDDQRKAVLAGFMAFPNGARNDGVDGESADETTKEGLEVVKELVKALSKKL